MFHATKAKEYARKCAEKLYGESSDDEGGLPSDGAGDEDIESTIQREVQDMKRPKRSKLFTAVRIDVQCRMFSNFITARFSLGR